MSGVLYCFIDWHISVLRVCWQRFGEDLQCNLPPSEHRQYWKQIQKYISFYDAVDSKKKIKGTNSQSLHMCRCWPPSFVSVCKCLRLRPDNPYELYLISTSANVQGTLHPASNCPCLSCLHMPSHDSKIFTFDWINYEQGFWL